MLTLHDFGQHGMLVMDGPRRSLAKARPIRSGGYLLAGDGLCWMDPRARAVNRVTKSIDARYLHVKTRREAKRILAGLVAQCR
jgi:hypothetical protein